MENKPRALTQKYEVGRLLGQGTFAKVYYATSKETNQSVAIKVIEKEKILRLGLVDQTKREITGMKIARHPNIVQLYEVMATKSRIFFVMEYAEGGELLHKVPKGGLEEDVGRKYFQQLIDAVDFCHSRGVYHRDIKPENLLLDENENLKISDFGLSALAKSKRQDGLLHTTCGTPAYIAPEVIDRKGYDGAKADIWSCGVVLFVLLAGRLPFHDPKLTEMYTKIRQAHIKFPNGVPPEVRRLLMRILHPNPNTRICMAKIKESSWFRKGLKTKQIKSIAETKDAASLDKNGSGPSETSSVPCESTEGPARPPYLNAFEIISLSPWFDLSGLFESNFQKTEATFASQLPPSVIISKLEDIGKRLSLKVKKKEPGLLKFESHREGKKGPLSIHAEIFEVSPSVHLVELKKSGGDTLEYQKIMNEGIRPALREMVWVWQVQPEQQAPHQQEQELQQQYQLERSLSH